MPRPKENRIRRVIHVLPPTDDALAEQAQQHGTLGKVVDDWAKRSRNSRSKRKPATEPKGHNAQAQRPDERKDGQ